MPAKTGTYTLIGSTTLGSTQSGITFSSIPQTYTDLVFVINGISNPPQNIQPRVGSGSVDTGSNYGFIYIDGSGSSASTGRFANETRATVGAVYSGRGTMIFNIQDYSNTTTFKPLIGTTGTAGSAANLYVSMWRSTSAIDIVTFVNPFDSGTTIKLYGIEAGNQ